MYANPTLHKVSATVVEARQRTGDTTRVIARLHVSLGNRKTGKTPGINLTPVRTCPGATEGCKASCYAMKAYKQYPDSRQAWDENSALAETNPFLMYAMVDLWLQSKRTLPSMFRWHSSGDFVSPEHFLVAERLALKYPTVQFYAYTKNRDLLPYIQTAPTNLVVRVSMWTDLDVPNARHPLAWYQDGTEGRADGVVCPATNGRKVTCDRCRICSHTSRSVVFNAH